MPSEIPVVFHNGSNYDDHFIINESAKEFEGQFECLEENTQSYQTFLVPIEKQVTNIDKDGNENAVAMSYRIKFFYSARYMIQVHYQILLIISQKEFIKLSVKIVIVFLNMKVSRTVG